MIRTPIRLLVLALTAALAVLTVALPAQAATTPYCGITWGSLAKSGTGTGADAAATGVRAGRHSCYDRLVIDLRGAPASWSVGYVGQVREDPSDRPVSLAGAADLQIRLHGVDGNALARRSDPLHLVDVTGFRTLRQVALTGSFEGVTSLGAGVRAHLPFRTFALPAPGGGTRVVVDIAHHWQQ